MRAILVDDERLARRELRRLLLKHPQVEVMGEAANADEARDASYPDCSLISFFWMSRCPVKVDSIS